MPETVAPLLSETIEIAAPPERVWALVQDLPRMSRWSPQVWRSFLRTPGPVRLGSQLVNINRRGWQAWPTQSKVVRFTPYEEIAFRIKENKSIWSYTLTPTDDGGTRVVHERVVPDGISQISLRLTKVAFGGQDAFGAELVDGMRETLRRIKEECEQ
ncbi:MAG: SRPBCC family protein [Nocardioides sp.]|uniref:SRPBCC family protein n=1 Tax=Nocardioides sp. TaxID=35761 RepID=UPI003F0BF818